GIFEASVAQTAQHVQEASAVNNDVGNTVVVEVHDNGTAPAVAPGLMRPVRRAFQSPDGVRLARESALAICEVDHYFRPFHADQIGMTILVEVPDAVDAAFFTQARLARHIGPFHRTSAAKDLSPRWNVEVSLPGDQLELPVPIEIDRDCAGPDQPGRNHSV